MPTSLGSDSNERPVIAGWGWGRGKRGVGKTGAGALASPSSGRWRLIDAIGRRGEAKRGFERISELNKKICRDITPRMPRANSHCTVFNPTKNHFALQFLFALHFSHFLKRVLLHLFLLLRLGLLLASLLRRGTGPPIGLLL